jgi:uncharacterized protein (DUF2236 family)
MPSIIRLPRPCQQALGAAAIGLLTPEGKGSVDFSRPPGEHALVPPDSVTWRVFKNPVALFVGGVTAVLLELAEPAVRAGVWEHSSFRRDPLGRLQRTALAAMVTVYGPRSLSEPMIAGIVRMHSRVQGQTSEGVRYAANDADLLNWVQVTASFGFAEAYSRYVTPLSREEHDALYREAVPGSRLFGAHDSPTSRAGMQAAFESMRNRLEPSSVVFEFLNIMRDTTTLPSPLRWMQGTLVRAAVELLPPWVRERLGLGASYGLRPTERILVRWAGIVSDRVVLADWPACQSCVRLGLPANYLYS